MGRIRAMEVGETQTFPIAKLRYIYSTCSIFSRTINKRYSTTYEGDTATVRRIA